MKNATYKILVVMHDQLWQDFFHVCLNSDDYSCESLTNDNYAGLNFSLQNHSFDLLIIDLFGCWKHDCLEQMEADDSLKRTKVIMTSGKFTPLEKFAVPSFADEFLIRPFACEDLLAAVNRLLK